MNSLHSVVRKVFGLGTIQRRTRRLDPTIRSALQYDVAEETSSLDVELREVESELIEATARLNDALRKEQFVSLRISKYRKVLEERARALRSEQNETTTATCSSVVVGEARETTPAESTSDQESFKQNLQQFEKDEAAMVTIIATHKQIVVDCELMRRSIDHLRKKKEHILSLTNECHVFLKSAADAQRETTPRIQIVQSEDDIELGDSGSVGRNADVHDVQSPTTGHANASESGDVCHSISH